MFTGRCKQFTFSDQIISSTLAGNNRIAQLKKAIPWDEINKIYGECFPSKLGNATKRTELAIGLLLLKPLNAASYRKLIDEVHRNIEFMHFCNVSLEDIQECTSKGKKIIDHSTLVKTMRRLGPKRMRRIEQAFSRSLRKHKIIKGRYVFSDTTSLEKNIAYPTEVSLIKRVIEHAEMVCQKVTVKKDMVKSAIIKKANSIAKVYYSAGKKTKELLTSTATQLIRIARERIEAAGKAIQDAGWEIRILLEAIYEKVTTVGKLIIEQTEQRLAGDAVTDKIVSYYEPHARALPKGKVHKPCEFGVKVRLDMSENQYITAYEVYTGNPSEAGMTETVVKKHAAVFGEEFKGAAMDRAFYDCEKNKELEDKFQVTLAIPHKKDRSKKMTKKRALLYNKRAAIEAKISEGKRMYGLNLCRYKGLAGDKTCAALAVFALNAAKFMRDVNKNSRMLMNIG
jgi:IS5 family transposase